MRPGESLHPSLLAFPYWVVNVKVRNCCRGVDELHGFYLLCHANGHTHMYLITSSIKIITKHVEVVWRSVQVSQDGFMLRLISVFLGCDMPIQLVLSSDNGNYDRLEDPFIMYWFTSWTTKYVTFYAWTNRLTRFYTCNLPITAVCLC